MKRTLFFIVVLFIASPALAETAEFIHCYDFGCKSTRAISFSPAQWLQIRRIFTPAATSAALEKQQIRHAIALMEDFAGQMTGTWQDRGGNYNGEDLAFQQDCIDESTNTYQYLMALQKRNLLHWHRVSEKQRRIRWFFTHWTATIEQIDNGKIYVVDSWYRDNGQPPYIQPLEDWRRKAEFPVSLNPD